MKGLSIRKGPVKDGLQLEPVFDCSLNINVYATVIQFGLKMNVRN